ncbi:MAG: putative Ig protein, partial [Verrucomicrobiaceae bacterium]|nr:putative Ig protein [Verrucomicrobiaceae bacterium]
EQTAITKNEADGTVTISVDISPAPTARVTIPITFAGTAVKGRNYSATQTSLVFDPNDASQTRDITLKLIDNAVDDVADKTVIIRLGAPTPVTQAYAIPGKDVATLTIADDDHKPVIASVQNFISGKVGTGYSYQIQATGATRYTVTGLPAGMTYNATTGLIEGRPTVAGEYDQIWITAINAAGVSTSTGYYVKVEDFSPVARGNFVGFVDRAGAGTSALGARIDLNITKAAEFTGKLTVGTTAYPLNGKLDTSTTNPTGSKTYVRGGITYTVAFTIDTGTGALTGTIGAAVISGWKAQTETLLSGLHNFITERAGGPITGDPHGASYGTATVAATGSVAATIHTSDGAVFATSAPVGSDGQVLVYQTAYTTVGSLLGNLTIANDGPHTLGGALTWSRPVQSSGGWATEIPLAVKGGKYRPVSGSAIVMNLAQGAGNNARLVFNGNSVQPASPNSPDISFRITAPATVVLPATHKLTIINATGAFSGSFKLSGATVVFPFQGVIVPATLTADPFDGAGNGYFLTPGTGSVVIRSGLVSLDPVL